MIGSALGMVQGEANEYNSHESQEQARDRCPEHRFCPESHSLLSLQVTYVAVLLPLTLYLIFLGYKIAYRGLNSLERGCYIYGSLLLIFSSVVACGSALLLPGFGYWIAFEGGWSRLLG